MVSLPFGDFRVFRGFYGDMEFGGGDLESSPLVLEGDTRDLVRVPVGLVRKVGGRVSEIRADMALKSHSEAERRRRERINAHLATLRSLIPCTDKLDKAGLLREVINHVKELKSSAAEISKRCTIPSDHDEVRVEVIGDAINEGSFSIKASLCCEDRPELLADLKQTVQTLRLQMVRAEISTLGGRIRNVMVMTCERNTSDIERQLFTNTVHQALNCVLDRVSLPSDFSPRTSFSRKRRRMSFFESFSSSS